MDHFQMAQRDDKSGWSVCHGGSVERVLECMQSGACPTRSTVEGEWMGFARRRRSCDAADTGVQVECFGRIPEPRVFDCLKRDGPLLLELSAQTVRSAKDGVARDRTLQRPNHAVAVVGRLRRRGSDYWVVRNSWGTHRAPASLPTDHTTCTGVGYNRCVSRWEPWRGMRDDPGFFLLPVETPALHEDPSPFIEVQTKLS